MTGEENIFAHFFGSFLGAPYVLVNDHTYAYTDNTNWISYGIRK